MALTPPPNKNKRPPLSPNNNIQNALAKWVIPRMPDVNVVPELSWGGWLPVLDVLEIDATADAEAAAEALRRARDTLRGLLDVALQQQAQEQEQQHDEQLDGVDGGGSDQFEKHDQPRAVRLYARAFENVCARETAAQYIRAHR